MISLCRRQFILLSLCSLGCVACAWIAPGSEDVRLLAMTTDMVTEAGYRSVPGDDKSVTFRQHRGDRDGGIDILLSMPLSDGPHPVIVYFPGFAEPVDAGQLWRDAWIRAGYAVLSIQLTAAAQALSKQPLSDDSEHPLPGPEQPLANGKPDRPNGPDDSMFRDAGRYHFSFPALYARLQQFQDLLNDLANRNLAEPEWLGRLDFSRLLLVGYDLGAQTVAALIGEDFNYQGTQPSWTASGAILLSPYVDLALGGLNNRYRNISAPLLVITGTEDDDPYGFGSAHSRTAIWEYVGSSPRYLLMVQQAGHQILSGNVSGPMGQTRHFPNASNQERGNEPAPLFNAPSDNERTATAQRGRNPNDYGRQRKQLDLHEQAMQIAAIWVVTTAFLDQTSGREGSDAEHWLTKKAQNWLGRSAMLTKK